MPKGWSILVKETELVFGFVSNCNFSKFLITSASVLKTDGERPETWETSVWTRVVLGFQDFLYGILLELRTNIFNNSGLL